MMQEFDDKMKKASEGKDLSSVCDRHYHISWEGSNSAFEGNELDAFKAGMDMAGYDGFFLQKDDGYDPPTCDFYFFFDNKKSVLKRLAGAPEEDDG